MLIYNYYTSIDACAESLFPDSGVQCPVMANSDPSSSSINDTVTVNVGTLSNAIAAAIQQSRTESSASGGRSNRATANSGLPQYSGVTPARDRLTLSRIYKYSGDIYIPWRYIYIYTVGIYISPSSMN